jgi:hypothetical protein
MVEHSKCKLIVQEGSLAGKEFELKQSPVLIGRDPAAEVLLLDEVVSRRHSRLTRQGDRYFLEDLGSSNGTFVTAASKGASPTHRRPDPPGQAVAFVSRPVCKPRAHFQPDADRDANRR